MHNLFLLGSPRAHGNSDTMAKAVAQGLLQTPGNSVEYIRLNTKSIKPCQACGGCSATGTCIIDDDMTELYAKTDQADRIFFTSPIYFYALTAQIKAYTDRCQARWARKYLLKQSHRPDENRTGYLLSCASTNGKKLFDGPIQMIKCLCDTLDIAYGKPLLIRNVESRNALQNLPQTLQTCEQFGTEIGANQ